MTRRLDVTEVEDRLRATLRERSDDVPVPDDSSGFVANEPGVVSLVGRRRARDRRLMFAAAVVLLLGGAVAIASTDNGSDAVVVGDNPDPTKPAVTEPVAPMRTCGHELPLRVTARGALAEPLDGPAPGNPPALEGQLVLHWPRAEGGAVEARWPAPPKPLYGSGGSPAPPLDASESVSPGRAEIDVHPRISPGDEGARFEPDVVIEPQSGAAPAPIAGCELIGLTITDGVGQWSSGMRVAVGDNDFPYELVDLQPVIVEQREVDVAPTTAIRCQGSDSNGTPPNRTGRPDPAVRGAAPAEILQQYLATSMGSIQSGYVEMHEADGSITYGVDPSGIGWTTLVFVSQDAAGWFLDGWTSSGC